MAKIQRWGLNPLRRWKEGVKTWFLRYNSGVKILVTGSHFTPAQAVIEQLQKHKDVEIVYVGRKYTREGDKTPSTESQVLPKLGIKFINLTTGRLQRAFTIYTIPSLLKIPLGLIQACYILLKEKPDVILSFGGYVAVPVVIWGWLFSIPVIIHEQTLVSGLANTISSYFADKIAVSFSENLQSFPEGKVVLTGNPLRKEILNPTLKDLDTEYKKIIEIARKDKLPVILVTAGNQGSHLINQTLSQILDKLIQEFSVIHQTGDSKFQDYENLLEQQKKLKHPERYLVKKWINSEDMGNLISQADLVVARAGMNTLVELAFHGISTLVIPIPYLHKNEQTVNARFFEKLGLSKTLLQKDLNSETLFNSIKEMIVHLDESKKRAKEARLVVIPDAAQRVALETILLVKQQIT